MFIQDNSFELFEEVLKSAKVVGTDTLRNIVINARSNPSNILDETEVQQVIDRNINIILKLVCKKFYITVAELLEGRSRKHGNRMNAVMVCAVLLEKLMDLRNPQISKILKKDYKNTTRLKSEYNRLSKDNKFDAIIIKKCIGLETKIAEQLEKLN